MQTDIPLVSVGLPIYNRPEGLRRTLECFVNQTYANIEIIIADNCSPDPEVEKIAREYVAKDVRISYFRHEENKGWGYNTNFVIEKAKGEYFLRATDDDWWDSIFIEEIITLMLNDENSSLGFCDFIEVDEKGEKSKIHPSDHLSLLRQFNDFDKIKNLKKYIYQFESFGKADLYFSIFKTENIKNEFVKNLLMKQILAADLIINFYSLIKGNLVLCPKMLLKVSFENEKLYDNNRFEQVSTSFNFQQNYLKIKNVSNKWHFYFRLYLNVINKSSLSLSEKIQLKIAVYRRIHLFNFDLMMIFFRRRVTEKGVFERKITLE